MRWRRRQRSTTSGSSPVPPPPRLVPVREDVIRLGQFLKLADMVDSGSDAKPLLAEGLVRVNEEVETRRGRQLRQGDVVALGDDRAQVG